METGTDYDAGVEDYTEYVDGDNGANDYAPVKTETRIVGDVTVREFPARSWSPQQVTVDEFTVQQIAGRLPARTLLTLVNLDAANSVFLAPTREQCIAGSRSTHELKPGAQFIMKHTGEVYAICLATKTATVSLVGEFRDGGL